MAPCGTVDHDVQIRTVTVGAEGGAAS